ncbi:MAG: ribonuclease H-like domain-containing protein [Candidatus Pacebacteria bacterium]|nr:ribonuclease H-like domain-containing protein [Candidatus Paceibacterota bacterium]
MRKVVFDIETKNTFEDVGKADPALLDISMVCVYDYETNAYHSYLQEELPQLWPLLEQTDMLIGYNSDHFDIPLLNKYYHGDLTRIKSLDLLKEIKNSLGRRLRLDSVAEATLGVKKSGHGLDAIRWWQQGEIDKIRQYCLDDVKITKEVYDYAMKNGKLRYMDFSEKKNIALDTSDWERDEDKGATMTHSLPF